MPFLEKADYKYAISISVLDQLVGYDDTIIDQLSAEAVIEMRGSLNSRYDVNTIFSVTGSGRNKTLLMYCTDIALYHIYSISLLNPIPQLRVDRYNHALQWLQDVNEQKINPEGLPLNTKSFVKTGSNDKRINQQQ